MNSRCIYLDRDFWSDTPKDKDVLSGIYRILKSNDIYTNINKEELLSDRILSQLCQDGGFRFYYDANLPEELTIKDHESLTSSMCLCNNKTGNCAEKYGFLAFNSKSVIKYAYIFEYKSKWIYEDRNYEKGWKDVFTKDIERNPLCNSMIINDKFICKEGNLEGITDNLKSLLDVLLPNGPQALDFHLSVFCKIDNRDKGNKVYKNILKYLTEIRPNLNILLSLYTSSDVHNRFVLTNSYVLEVGAGFNLFKNGKAENGSEYNYYYPLTIGNNEIFIGKLKQVEKVFSDSYQKECFRNFWGEKKNRLFDLIS